MKRSGIDLGPDGVRVGRGELAPIFPLMFIIIDQYTYLWERGFPFSELCTHGKQAYKYVLQATGIYFIINYTNRNSEG